ncbi:hypothetical protein D3C71_1301110 [compost metagenome]
MVTSVLCSQAQPRLTYHSHPEPVELRWVSTLLVNEAYWKLSSTGGSVIFGGVMPCSKKWVSQIPTKFYTVFSHRKNYGYSKGIYKLNML